MGRIDGQVAVVTGAAKGIGRAIAERLAAEGARIALGDIDGAELKRVADAIAAAGGTASVNNTTNGSITATTNAIFTAAGVPLTLSNSGSISGTYAELALCTSEQVHSLPEKAPFAQGAALGVPYATAYRALFVLLQHHVRSALNQVVGQTASDCRERAHSAGADDHRVGRVGARGHGREPLLAPEHPQLIL